MAAKASRKPGTIDQPALIHALMRLRTFPDHPKRFRLVQTHLSYVFITPKRVYKIKKALNLGFVDYSTLSRRRRFCEAEVAVNRRLAPRVYLGVEPVTLVDGKPVIGGKGTPVEYAVVMRHVPDSRLLLRRLRKRPGDYPRIDEVVERLVRFYRDSQVGVDDPDTGPGSITRIVNDNFTLLEKFTGTLFDSEIISDLKAWSRGELKALGSLIRRRVGEGRAVEGHGDLHLAHIYVNGNVEILDAIEFARRYRVGDVAQDVAFLAMDLEFRDRHDLSRHLIRRLSKRLRDPELPRLLPLYKSYRALVRAKVNAIMSQESEVPQADLEAAARRARRYLRLAVRIARWRGRPTMIVMGGLSGTGKSRIGLDIARRYGTEWLATDVIRKLLAGIDPFTEAHAPHGRGVYAPVHRRRTMRALMREAADLLREGRTVVLDGTFQNREDRAQARRLAGRLGVPICFVWCHAPAATVRKRLAVRGSRGNISDATWSVYQKQKARYDPPTEIPPDQLITIETTASIRTNRRLIDRILSPLAVASPGPVG